jgi:hypothetical protein
VILDIYLTPNTICLNINNLSSYKEKCDIIELLVKTKNQALRKKMVEIILIRKNTIKDQSKERKGLNLTH